MFYFLTVTDCTKRSYSIYDNGQPYVANELVVIDNNETRDHDTVIRQYVWNKYGLTSGHRKACRHCDPRDDCWSGTCDLRVSYYPVDPSMATVISYSGPPKVDLPDNWPSTYQPLTMFGQGKLIYR